MKRLLRLLPWVAAFLALAEILGCSEPPSSVSDDSMSWLAGDHHVHSRYSVSWDRGIDPPEPMIGGAGVLNSIPLNALMAKNHGLAWMVATDHGSRYHSEVTLKHTYPNLLVSREVVPEVIQFLGLEFNAPGAEHSSVIMPRTSSEAERLFELEAQFDRNDADPSDLESNTVARMLEALAAMDRLPEKPIVFVNHPSRTASGGAPYGLVTPAELRQWNDAAPEVAVGMVGAPGHQASSINSDGSLKIEGARGGMGYLGSPATMGGFDPMTARLGGFWDSMLGEGRRYWISANSDSHRHWSERGVDFWPGEYSKTYVYAESNHDSILEGIRAGRIFVTTGDLVSELYVNAAAADGDEAGIGGTLDLESGESVTVTIRVRDPGSENSHGDRPTIDHVDLIVGEILGVSADSNQDTNATTRVVRSFNSDDWTRNNEFLTMTERLDGVSSSLYLRVRGTSTDQTEPAPDPEGEDPWSDLWFYSNPVFLEID